MGDSELRVAELCCWNWVQKNKINRIVLVVWHKRARLELDLNEWNWEWRQGRGVTEIKFIPTCTYYKVSQFSVLALQARWRVPPSLFFFYIPGQLPLPCARMFSWEPLNTTPQFFTLKIWSVCKETERICRLLLTYQLFWHRFPHDLSWEIL